MPAHAAASFDKKEPISRLEKTHFAKHGTRIGVLGLHDNGLGGFASTRDFPLGGGTRKNGGGDGIEPSQSVPDEVDLSGLRPFEHERDQALSRARRAREPPALAKRRKRASMSRRTSTS